MNTVGELINRLKRRAQVIGLMEFGSRDINSRSGDYDLLAVLVDNPTGVRSLHFWWGQTPIDLNLRTVSELRQVERLSHFDQTMLEGRMLFDRTDQLVEILEAWRAWSQIANPWSISADKLARIRHWHRHVLDKVRNRPEPLARYLLGMNLGVLAENYFRVRQLPYRGPKASWDWLGEHEPDIGQLLEQAAEGPSLDVLIGISERLTDLVLEPAGGPWRPDEVLACGSESAADLAAQGQSIYEAIVGLDFPSL